MRALEQYVEQKNTWASLFKGRQLSLDSAEDRQRIADSIDAALSPENLTCDGELTRSQVQARYRELQQVARELRQLDPQVRMYEAV